MHRFIISLLLLSIFQAATLSGFLRDANTGEPVSYASIFIKDTDHGTASTVDGYFVITDIKPGAYSLYVQMIGYEKYEQLIIIDESIRLDDIKLVSAKITSDDVIVSAQRQKFKESVESSVISVNLKEINFTPAFIEADVFRSLQMLPGVQKTNDFSSALYVRGSTPDQNLIMLDGITVYNPYHFGGLFSTFNTDAIKQADFHAGGFPARYGGRMGAILNIINREGNTERIKGSGNISLLSSKILLEGPIKFIPIDGVKGSWLISGRRTYFDKVVEAGNDIINNIYDTEFDLVFPYKFYDYQIKVNLDFGINNRLTYTRFYGDDLINYRLNLDEFLTSAKDEDSDEEQTAFQESIVDIDWPWGNHTNGLTWRYIASPNVFIKTFLASSRYRFDLDARYENNLIDTVDSTRNSSFHYGFGFTDIINDFTVESELTWIPTNKHTVTAGYQIKNVSYELNTGTSYSVDIFEFDTTMTVTPLDMRDTTIEVSIYVQDKYRVNSDLTLQVGLRTTSYNLHESLYHDPRLGIKYQINDNMSFKFNWGIYHQFLTIANNPDENFRIIDLWLGVPESKSAPRSEHTIIGFEYLSSNDILFRVESYYKDFQKMFIVEQGSVFEGFDNGYQTTSFNNLIDTDAYSYGLELLIKKSSGNFNGWIGYSYSETFYRDSTSAWYNPNFDRTHTLSAVTNYNLFKDFNSIMQKYIPNSRMVDFLSKLTISSALSLNSGNPYTPLLARTQDWGDYMRWDDDNTMINDWYQSYSYIVGEKNSMRYAPYFRLDLSISKVGSLFGIKTKHSLQILNITNNVNILTYFYRTKIDPQTRDRLGVERRPVPMFPLIATYGISFEF